MNVSADTSETPCCNSDHKVADPVVCACFQVRHSQITQAVDSLGLTSVKEVCRFTSAGSGCNACRTRIKALLTQANRVDANSPAMS